MKKLKIDKKPNKKFVIPDLKVSQLELRNMERSRPVRNRNVLMNQEKVKKKVKDHYAKLLKQK